MNTLLQRRCLIRALRNSIALLLWAVQSVFAGSFVNFETAPVHPLALSSDNRTLAVCNLPDNRLLLFDVSGGGPIQIGEVPVGLDPVSVRFRTTNEIWVVNHISSSVSIVDLARRTVTATLDTLAGPADVVFAGSPQRAFVSCARTNTVMVFDPLTHTSLTNLAIEGERPKAMAASPDGLKVYATIFESGNGTTILGRRLTSQNTPSAPGVVDDTNGPYAGQNPPPNSGASFSPPRNPNVTNTPPPVAHIVRKNATGHWLDDNNADWTEFISGTNAALSGRVQGWDLPDHDLAVIDTATLGVTYTTGLMNLCLGLGVNPASGEITVVGTDATNERRFEPNLKGVFIRVNAAVVNPTTLSKSVVDLNPHLDYLTNTVPVSERDKSISDPRGIVWNAAGTRGYISGMGSRNLAVIGADGHRARTLPIEVGEGPTGLALDEARQRLYVLNRFSASLSVVDTVTETVVTNAAFYDPTPDVIKKGRRHLYDTRKTSGLGHISCASCHADARGDRLAWDLGNPAGTMITNSLQFHPMKGPMVTQTLQDILLVSDSSVSGRTPLHWRGDRNGIEDFNGTFTNLMSADASLTPTEMEEFKGLITNIFFPPNPYRTFDNTLSTNVPLPGMFGRGLDGFTPNGAQLPPGNALTGRSPFISFCTVCHGFDRGGGETFIDVPRNTQTVKNAQLRSIADKLGLDMTRTNSRSGFGFLHDGTVDTLSRFLIDGFNEKFSVSGGDQQLANMIAFLLSFNGSDLSLFGNPNPSRDVPAAVGRQITLIIPETNSLLIAMTNRAHRAPGSRVELVVQGKKNGMPRSWFYDRSRAVFQSDRNGETNSLPELLALAASTNEMTFTMVPLGTGRRMAIDRDEDFHFNRTELDSGTDPSSALSSPLRLMSLSRTGTVATIRWPSLPACNYSVLIKTNLTDAIWSELSSLTATSALTTVEDMTLDTNRQRFYQVRMSDPLGN